MYENLEKLRDEVKRCRKRIENDKARLKFAEDKLDRAENSQIVADVKAVNLTPEQLAEFLKLVTSGTAGNAVKAVTEESVYDDTDEENETEDFEDEEN